MFDQYMIRDDSLRPAVGADGAAGFRLDLMLPYYRGLGLSMVEDIAITIDEQPIPRGDIVLELRGRSWTLDELETEYAARWNFGEVATVFVRHAGTLAAGLHRVDVAERLRVSYLPFTPTTRASKILTVA